MYNKPIWNCNNYVMKIRGQLKIQKNSEVGSGAWIVWKSLGNRWNQRFFSFLAFYDTALCCTICLCELLLLPWYCTIRDCKFCLGHDDLLPTISLLLPLTCVPSGLSSLEDCCVGCAYFWFDSIWLRYPRKKVFIFKEMWWNLEDLTSSWMQ